MEISLNHKIKNLSDTVESLSLSGGGSSSSLSSFVGCKSYMTGFAELTVFQSNTNIPFNTIDYDIGGNFNTITNEYTIPSDGLYTFIVRLALQQSATSNASVGLYRNNEANPLYRNGKLSGNSENLITNHMCIAGEIYKAKISTGPMTINTLRPWSEFIITKIN